MMRKERLADGSIRAETEIINRLGLHARAAARFVETAARFTADVTVSNGDESVGLMMLAAAEGTTLVLHATGPDAEEAVDALGALIADKFHEGF